MTQSHWGEVKDEGKFQITILKGSSKNVIPAEAGIQKVLKSLDSRLRGSDELRIIGGSLKYQTHFANPIKTNPKVRIRAPAIRVFHWVSFRNRIPSPAPKRALT